MINPGETKAIPMPNQNGELPEAQAPKPEPEFANDDEELQDMVAGEIMHAFKTNDKKGFLEGLRALVLSSME